jgi:hypothetical protein
VLVKHSKSFSLIDCISVGLDRMQRNFESMRKQVEAISFLSLRSESLQQIANRKQRQTKNSTRQIEIMTNASFKPPMHPRQQMKCFEYVGKNDY